MSEVGDSVEADELTILEELGGGSVEGLRLVSIHPCLVTTLLL